MRTPLKEGVPAGSSGPVRPEGAVGEGQQKLQRARTVSHMESERESRKCGWVPAEECRGNWLCLWAGSELHSENMKMPH